MVGKCISFSHGTFSGDMLVFQGVTGIQNLFFFGSPGDSFNAGNLNSEAKCITSCGRDPLHGLETPVLTKQPTDALHLLTSGRVDLLQQMIEIVYSQQMVFGSWFFSSHPNDSFSGDW